MNIADRSYVIKSKVAIAVYIPGKCSNGASSPINGHIHYTRGQVNRNLSTTKVALTFLLVIVIMFG